ncbi:MAG: glutamine--fructose-6-phosphate aminotransferase, partial [Deltaproteobacteria bacterium]|nr:glutamine--fructose-6-phosphate aminotransferase [Deltaproteobacteria bacterium]
MCGVIGLVFDQKRNDLGRVAAELLQMLEYRGYDSTGAAIQDGEEVTLRKGVGAPSVMVHELGIVNLAGQIMAGQVRWATFGAVDEQNSQPHVVRCKTFMYGAHNGNVTNSDDQKKWLIQEGHAVVSDNDGEMVVHTIEHLFAQRLREGLGPMDRRAAMRAAIVDAAAMLKGSFAAVVVDPVSRASWAIKLGSSLYFGFG